MPIQFMTVEEEYEKNKELKKEDVRTLQEWVEKQGHLPELSEFKLILFLQSCYFRMEAAKVAIENFYTVKTHCPEIFKLRDAGALERVMDVFLSTILPGVTDKGYKVTFTKVIDTNPERYIYADAMALFNMTINLKSAQLGTNKGALLICDSEGLTMGHLLKINITLARKLLFYLQEGFHVRLMGVHIINAIPIVNKILNLLKSFIKPEIFEMIHLHSTLDTLFEHVPQRMLAAEQGGQSGTFKELQDEMKRDILDNHEFFKQDALLLVDESKRVGKSRVLDDMGDVGMEGTFKKLSID